MMNAPKLNNVLLATVLIGLFAASCYWLAPGSRLAESEIDRYLGRMEAGLAMEGAEKREFLQRLRRWALAEDGRPVHMLNLMRFRDAMPPVPGHPEFAGTPEQANAYYEQRILPLLAARGIYPVFASSTQGVATPGGGLTNLIGFYHPGEVVVHGDATGVVEFFSLFDKFQP